MKRSSSIQPYKRNIKLPNGYQHVFDAQRYSMLQKITSMINSTVAPAPLLMVSPKISEHLETILIKKQSIQSRRNINLKLINSDRKHVRLQTKFIQSSLNVPSETEFQQISNSVIKQDANKSKKTPIKSLAFSILEKVKEKIYKARYICAPSENTPSATANDAPLILSKLEDTLKHNQVKISSKLRYRPSSTLNRKTRNSLITWSQTNARRQSMPKIIKRNEHRGSCIVVNEEPIHTPYRTIVFEKHVENAIDSIPISAWGNDERTANVWKSKLYNR